MKTVNEQVKGIINDLHKNNEHAYEKVDLLEDLIHYLTTELRELQRQEIEEEEVIYSCCGDEMTIDLIDYGRCPTCKEHCM